MTIKTAKQVTGGQPPIGQPFEYTETLDLASDKKVPWWKFWLRPKKRPVAWLVSDHLADDDEKVKAHVVDHGEIRISPIEPRALEPIYIKDVVDDLLLAAEGRVEQDTEAWLPDSEELEELRQEMAKAMAADYKLLREREEKDAE